ncbi:MAG TPA: alpha-hydroxy acid oxidase [Mycobacteriales bacterium]|jgi:isopentenyl diphosphate isomerase/L-lactate dehydrogenase-like FMN-dependent dehydrogenase|nr:alpha-hydroxy acid oxidase [Mycobacteriales bacterium]
MRLHRTVTVADVRAIAKRRLPSPVFDIIDGAAGDEYSLRRNTEAFQDITFRPRTMVDVRKRTTATTVFGQEISMPVMLAPTGAGRVISRHAELAVARAASAAGTVYMQSTATAYPLEEVARQSTSPLWYQLYLPRGDGALEPLLARVAEAGYTALAITVDTPIFGNRERDIRHRSSIPARISPTLVLQGMSRPRWAVEFVRANTTADSLRRRASGQRRLTPSATQKAIIDTQYPVTWADVERVRALWQGPLLIKGIMRSDECDRYLDHGVDGFVVSNHGGRQLDGVPATIEVLPEVVAVVGGRVPVFLDGGVRRGTDVVKALALGASAVFVGRPYLFGLAAGGQAGVERVLELYRWSIDHTMAMLGVTDPAELDRSFVNVGPAR